MARTPGEKYPHRHVEAEPPRPNVAPGKIEALIEKEVGFKKQQRAAEEALRQLIYIGQVPWEIITEDGTRIAAPKHLSGGNQWYEALRSNSITFRPGIHSVTGFPVISQDALEAAFNADETVKAETHRRDVGIYNLFKATSKANPQAKRGRIYEIMRGEQPDFFINRREPTSGKILSDQSIGRIIREKQRQ